MSEAIDTAFEHYFHRRAQLAEQLVEAGWNQEASTLATSTIDALATIWFHDFPAVEPAIRAELAGAVPASIRMARFLKTFASQDAEVRKIAVVCFAEDWMRYAPKTASIAERLLKERLGKLRGELPHSYKDLSIEALLLEAPELRTIPGAIAMTEDYEYGALLYSIYRCPLVHHASPGRRVHGFTRGTEVMYMRLEANRTRISFGPNLITSWLRASVTGYVHECARIGIAPARDFVPGSDQEDRLKNRWTRLVAKEAG